MKQYFTGFFTGVCLMVSAVMFMGAGQSNSKIGKYAVYVSFGVEYLLDTETGQSWKRDYYNEKKKEKEEKNRGKKDKKQEKKWGWYPRESAFLEIPNPAQITPVVEPKKE